MKPLASIVICTYNRSKDLKNVLDSLLKQKIDKDLSYEIIVSDNNSSDHTKDLVLSDYADLFAGRLKYIFEPHQGKSYALNSAIEASHGSLICFTDDDVILDEFWLSKTIECFKQYDCDGVGGRVLPIFPACTEQWIKENASKLSGSVVIYDHGDKTCPLTGSTFPFIGANFSFKREIFKQAGSFRTDLGGCTGAVGEDTEFVNRLLARGKSLYYCGAALIWHPFDRERLTLKHIAKWNISLGKFATRMESEKATQFIYYFGIPRYLLRGIIVDFFKLLSLSWTKPSFFIAWRNLFCKVGMIQEYHKFYRKGAAQHAQS
jgi:glucosyl-dolichyl phosphate glucuronosyltransferase